MAAKKKINKPNADPMLHPIELLMPDRLYVTVERYNENHLNIETSEEACTDMLDLEDVVEIGVYKLDYVRKVKLGLVDAN